MILLPMRGSGSSGERQGHGLRLEFYIYRGEGEAVPVSELIGSYYVIFRSLGSNRCLLLLYHREEPSLIEISESERAPAVPSDVGWTLALVKLVPSKKNGALIHLD